MLWHIVFHPLALQDITDAYAWYEAQKNGVGERFLAAIEIKLERINEYPGIYGYRSKNKFREAPLDLFPYHIVYKTNKVTQEIYISSVHHTSKHPRKKYRRQRQ